MNRVRLLLLPMIVLGLVSSDLMLGAVKLSPKSELSSPESAAFSYAEMEWGRNWIEYYSYLHPDAQAVIPESAMIGWYENSFQPMDPAGFSITNVSYVTWTWGVTGESYRNTAKVSYWQLDPNHGNGGYGDVLHLVEHEGAWRWFFGGSWEFIEEQIRLYGNSDSASYTSTNSTSETPQREQSAVAECTLVELYPGYPGYEGFVTGVAGIGDHTCLEDLESDNPGFSREREDDANRDAARAIGLTGGPEVWTWENWLQIEAERGMTPTCYSCAGFAGIRAEPTGTDVRVDDPRLILGMLNFETYYIYESWARDNGDVPFALRFTDQQLHIVVRTFYGTLNAQEVIDAAYKFQTDWYPKALKSIVNIDTSLMWDTIISQGGYFDVPISVSPQDERNILLTSLEAMTPFSGSHNVEHLRSLLLRAYDDWFLLTASGDYGGNFTSYLQEIGADGWY